MRKSLYFAEEDELCVSCVGSVSEVRRGAGRRSHAGVADVSGGRSRNPGRTSQGSPPQPLSPARPRFLLTTFTSNNTFHVTPNRDSTYEQNTQCKYCYCTFMRVSWKDVNLLSAREILRDKGRSSIYLGPASVLKSIRQVWFWIILKQLFHFSKL